MDKQIPEKPWLAWCKDGHYFFAETAAKNVKCKCGNEMSGAAKMDELTPTDMTDCSCESDEPKHWHGCDVSILRHLIASARKSDSLEAENRRLKGEANKEAAKHLCSLASVFRALSQDPANSEHEAGLRWAANLAIDQADVLVNGYAGIEHKQSTKLKRLTKLSTEGGSK